MPPQKSLNEKVDEYKRDLDTIEASLTQLRREYDLYFAGARKRQPYELKSQIERLLKKWRASTISKLELSFRLNTLNSKYNAMTDVWDKIFQRREIDPKALSPFGPTTAQLAAEQGRSNREAEAREARSAQMAAPARPVDKDAAMRRLFDQYVDAKKDMGEAADNLTYDRFRAQLEKQTAQIQSRTDCADVEFGVVRKQGKVSLTAKPIKK